MDDFERSPAAIDRIARKPAVRPNNQQSIKISLLPVSIEALHFRLVVIYPLLLFCLLRSMTATTTPASVVSTIPVIDLSQLLPDCIHHSNADDDNNNEHTATSNEEEQAVAQELVHALKTIGFVTLQHHGIDTSSALEAAQQFFALETCVKLQYPYQGHDSNRGYIPMGSERHDNDITTTADRKETLELDDRPETIWPTELRNTTFQSTLLEYYQQCNLLQLKLLRLIAMGLKLSDPNYFVKRCDQKHCNLRLLHYPSLTVSVEADDTAATSEKTKNKEVVVVRGARHTDFGTLTLLAQDSVGGLRVQPRRRRNSSAAPTDDDENEGDEDDGWISVLPTPGALVLNVGDMLQRWTNDQLQATPHQVVSLAVPTPDDAMTSSAECRTVQFPERYSVAFFCNANPDTILEPVMSQLDSDSKPISNYKPITSKEYLRQRLAATIATSTTKI